MGKGFTAQPVVSFSSAPSGGVTSTGIASVSYSYPACDGKSGRVSAIHITNAGCGYTVPPVITVNGGGGSGFAATTGISTNGSIQSFTVTDGGAGYYNAPTVSIGKTAGTYPLFGSTIYSFDSSSSTFDSQFPDPERPAVGLATISSSGIVTAIYVIDGGEGFDTVPVVTISGPAVNNIVSVGGTFIFNEVVTGSTS